METENIVIPPKVSIIMSVYNREFNIVKRAMDSVLAQEFKDFRLIVVDDGSNSILGKSILDYTIKNESKLTYIRHKNQGQARSVNKAIRISRSPLIGFIDSDDEYKPTHIMACLRQINRDCDLICSITETKVNNPNDYFVPDKNNLNCDIHIDDCITFGTLFGKREVFLNIGFKNIYSSDSDFYERASKVYKTKKLNLKTYIYYLGGTDSITTEKKQNRTASWLHTAKIHSLRSRLD